MKAEELIEGKVYECVLTGKKGVCFYVNPIRFSVSCETPLESHVESKGIFIQYYNPIRGVYEDIEALDGMWR